MALTDDRGTAPEVSSGGNPGFDKQPPQDLPAEQSVLGGMMLSKDAIADVVEVLRPGDFYRPAHQSVYDCVLDLYSRGEPADPITVAAELERRGELRRIGGAPYLHTLIATVPTAANAGYYAEIVAEKAVLRRLVEAGTRIVQLGYSGQDGSDVNEIVDRAQSAIYEVTERRTTEDYVALEELLQPTMDEIDAIASRGGSSLGVPTGFADFDEITNGLHPGQMIIVAARPGVGKALALDTPLPTPDGWTTMGSVAVGDRLIGADDKPTNVVAATEVMHGRPCYEVEFADGTVIVADEQHEWPTSQGVRTTGGLKAGDVIAAHALEHSIVDVRPVASVPVRCVEVDNVDHVYLAGPSMVPTHNSTLGLDWARSCSIRNGMTSVIFSLEMSRTEIVMRMLSAEAKIRLADMRGGRMTDDDWTRLARRMSEISEAPLFIDDSPNMTMMEIRAKARRLKQRHDLKLIVLDYMQLMTSGKRVESRQQEVSEFSRQLKLLAKELEVPVVAMSQLNRGPEQRTDKRPMLADLRESGCLTSGTRVLRADSGGETTLGELLASGETPVVWSLDDRLRMVARPMTKVFSSGTKEVFRLRMTSGRQVEATANHPFMTVDGWVPLGELRPRDRVAASRVVPEPLEPKELPEAEVILMAQLVGSSVRTKPVGAARHSGATAVLDEQATGQSVPPEVFKAPNEQVALFLHHLWATDGSIRWDDEGGQGRIYYASASRRLADDVFQLLLRVGVYAHIKRTRGAWHVSVENAADQLRFVEKVGVRESMANRLVERLRGVTGSTNFATVPQKVWNQVHTLLAAERMTHRQSPAAMGSRFCGSTTWRHSPSRSRLARVAAVLDDAELDLVATNDVFWDEVAEVESLGEQPVYDATVPGTHNFVANGVNVHNSLEQDADMVVLIHRPDAWERDDPRAGEADLILAKHRAGPTATVTVAHQLHYSKFADLAQA